MFDAELEFLGLNTMNDAIMELGSQLNNKIMVPLCCLVKYKGFLSLVEANLDLTLDNMVYGRRKEIFIQLAVLTESLQKIGKYLNIKQHPIKGKVVGDVSNPDLYLSQNLQLFRTIKPTLEEFYEKKKRKDPEEKSINDALALNLFWSQSDKARELDKEGFSQETLQTILKDDGEGIFFVKNAQSIFPVDLVFSQKPQTLKKMRLRPEFMKEYEKKLNPDLLQDGKNSKHLDQNDYELNEAGKYIKTKLLKGVAYSLDAMEYIPMDSFSLERLFHEYGLNVRYLGKVAEESRLPHIREFLFSEIIARSAKRLLDKETSHFILKAGMVMDNYPAENLVTSQIEHVKLDLWDEFDESLNQIPTKLLNCTLGSSPESEKFWEFVLKPQIFKDFDFTFGPHFRHEDLPKGSLIAACKYHFNINLAEKKYNLEQANPFTVKDFKDFKVLPTCYSYKRHKLRVASSLYEVHKESKNYDMAMRQLEVKLLVEDYLGKNYEVLETMAEIADIYYSKEDYNKAITVCGKALSQLDKYSPT